ncbi:hypothetical protein [Streptomyces sp. NPDC001933]|uniref:hypothetical protein n=1 Tax=Streptomyces sp. NPDC001933 TaxID=3364626 RepID=UPI003688A08A
MPYQEDLVGAFQGLRRKVFEEREYYWGPGADWWPEQERLPWPETEEELWEHELVQHDGTHSILDIFRITGPDEEPDHGTVKQVTEEEALRVLGARKLTRAHLSRFEEFDTGVGTGSAPCSMTTWGSRGRSTSGATPATEPTRASAG